MAKILEENLKSENLNNSSFQQNRNQETPNNPKEKGIINTLGQILPFAPLLFEQFTGQKIAQPVGTIADIQTSISQLTSSLQQVLANQQQIFNKINALESNANQQLLSLNSKLQNLRLTHEREKKQIEFNANHRNSLEEDEN